MRPAALTIVLALAPAVLAQDPLDGLPGLDDPLGGADAGADAAGPRVTGLKGFVETRGRWFFRDSARARGRRDAQWIQEIQLEFDLQLADGLTGYFRPRFLVDVLDSDLSRTEPLEAYVTLAAGDHELRAGQLVENWGIADTFNPIDVLNRRDIAEDPLDPVRLGELGARYRWFLPGGDIVGEPTLSAYLIPVWRRSLFPPTNSRWSFGQGFRAINEDLGDEPNGEDRLFFALRARSTLNTPLANADVQLVWARGPERFPLIARLPVMGIPDPVFPVYFGITTLGGGLRAVPNFEALDDFTLKAEVVHKRPYRFDQSGTLALTPDDYTQYAFGFDRLFPNVLTDKDQITATVEWVGEIGADDFTAQFRPFDDDLVLRLFWEANDFDRTSVELRGFADFDKQEYLAEAVFQRQLRMIHEDLQFEFGARWFDVARDTGFFSLFPNNSSLWMSFRFDF